MLCICNIKRRSLLLSFKVLKLFKYLHKMKICLAVKLFYWIEWKAFVFEFWVELKHGLNLYLVRKLQRTVITMLYHLTVMLKYDFLNYGSCLFGFGPINLGKPDLKAEWLSPTGQGGRGYSWNDRMRKQVVPGLLLAGNIFLHQNESF